MSCTDNGKNGSLEVVVARLGWPVPIEWSRSVLEIGAV